MMNSTFNKKSLAIAVSATVLGLGGAGTAHADAYAFAQNEITNFQILVNSGALTLNSGTRSTANTATYSAGPENNPVADIVVIPGPSNALEATAGSAPFPVQDSYVKYAGQTAGMTGTRADSDTSSENPFVEHGGTVAGGGGTLGVGSRLMQNVAEGLATGTNTGASSGKFSAAVNVKFTAESGTRLQLSFIDTIALFTSSTLGALNTGNATIANNFTVTDAIGTIVFEYTPGSIGGCNLNTSSHSNNGSRGSSINCTATALSQESVALAAGTYTLGMNTTSQQDVASQINPTPEPSSIALLGAGLLGLFGTSRRRGWITFKR